jgi:hypothetical protein
MRERRTLDHWLLGALAGGVVAAVAVIAVLVSGREPAPALVAVAGPAPATSTPASPAPDPGAVHVDTPGEWSWALRDDVTGEVIGSDNKTSFTNNTESMIKVWLATDYLRLADRDGRTVTEADQAKLERMIHISDNDAAQWAYLNDGGDAVIRRMISACGLRDTRITQGRWSKTQISASDAVLLGHCVTDGKLLSPRWQAWLIDQMKHVDPSNAFGISQAPALAGVDPAIKNGWTEHAIGDSMIWAVNCLAVWGHWTLAVLTNYPATLGLDHGAGICAQVTQQLFARPS